MNRFLPHQRTEAVAPHKITVNGGTVDTITMTSLLFAQLEGCANHDSSLAIYPQLFPLI